MRLRYNILSVVSLLLLGGVAGWGQEKYAGSFLEIPVGARALGLGGAFTAASDDGTAFYWNPSGVSLVETKTLSGMYSSQYGAIGSPLANYYFAGWSMPINTLGVSVNWIRFAVSDIPRYPDLTRVASVEERYRRVRAIGEVETFSDTEDAFIFSFARNNKIKFDLGWSYFDIPIEIPIGVNLKLIRQNLDANTASGIGIDVGAMLRFNLKDFFFSEDWPMISFGATMRDIGGTKISWSQTQRTPEIEQTFVYGLAITQPLKPIDSRAILTADISNRYGNEQSYGLEIQYKRQFSFRLGLNNSTLSAGAGIDFNFFDIDYAYLASSDIQLGSVHRLGVAFNFDKLLEKPQQ